MAHSKKMAVGPITNNHGWINVAGRDIVNIIQTIYERSLTAAEQAEKANQLEQQALANGVSSFLQKLSRLDAAVRPAVTPYHKLQEYRLGDADIFYGRSGAVRELFLCLENGPLTILQGESGAGKTSLLLAGIFPQIIANQGVPVYLEPYRTHPAENIKQIFLHRLSMAPLLAALPLATFLHEVSAIIGSQSGLYIFLDRFEEFFHSVSEEDQADFIDQLAGCLNDPSLDVNWLISIRCEELWKLSRFRSRIRNPFANEFPLHPLTRAEALEAMVEPAARFGLCYEEGLLDTILDDLGQQAIVPAQLQLVCSELYRTLEAGQKVFARAAYEKAGCAEGILRGYLRNVIEGQKIPIHDRSTAYAILEALVSSDHRRVRRTAAELADLLRPRQGATAAIDRTLEALLESRLLRVEETPDGPAVQLVHDYLLGEIQLDPGVIERKQVEELLEQGAVHWRRQGLLLGPDALALIERKRAEIQPYGGQPELLLRSAVRNHMNPAPWRCLLSPEQRLALVASARQQKPDPDRALLWTLRADLGPLDWGRAFAWFLSGSTRRWLPRAAVAVLALIGLAVLLLQPERSGWHEISPVAGPDRQAFLFAADPFNADRLYLVDTHRLQLLASQDGGGSWQAALGGMWAGAWPIQAVAASQGTVYLAREQTIFASANLGHSWQWLPLDRTTLADGEAITALAAVPKAFGHVFFGTSLGKVYALRPDLDLPAALGSTPGTPVTEMATNGGILLFSDGSQVWSQSINPPVENSEPVLVKLTGCLKSNSYSSPIQSLAFPRATEPQKTSFWASIGGQGICSANAKGTVAEALLEDAHFPTHEIYSLAVYGDFRMTGQVYIWGNSGLLCSRIWTFTEKEWWLNKMGGRVSCSDQEPVLKPWQD